MSLIADPRWRKATTLHQQGHCSQAVQLYRQLQKQYGRDPALLSALAAGLRQLGDLSASLTIYRQALQASPAAASVWFAFANALQAAGHIDQAQSAFEKTLVLDPRHSAAAFNLGRLALQQNRPDLAHQHFECATRIRPDYAKAWTCLGDCLRKTGDLERAEACHNRARQLAPTDSLVLFNAAIYYLQVNRVNAARRDLLHLLRHKPQWQAAHYRLAECDYQQSGAQAVLQSAQRYSASLPEQAPQNPKTPKPRKGLIKLTI